MSRRVGFAQEAEVRYLLEPPSEAMKADGAVDDPVSHRTVLLVDDLATLPWFEGVLGGLEVWDWRGARVSIASGSPG